LAAELVESRGHGGQAGQAFQRASRISKAAARSASARPSVRPSASAFDVDDVFHAF
jgi:hypothetical protein